MLWAVGNSRIKSKGQELMGFEFSIGSRGHRGTMTRKCVSVAEGGGSCIQVMCWVLSPVMVIEISGKTNMLIW